MLRKIRMNEIPMWQEERNFTKWLASNINCVGNIIGKRIVNVSTEVKDSNEYGRGKYAVDILAVDENNDKIVIENQYFLSNHLHLGELLTYAAWNDVSIIVWITESIDIEHYCAVDYIKKLAHCSNPQFEFWVLLVSPDESSDLTNNPNINLKITTKDDCIKKETQINLPQNAVLNTEFWNRFESVFPKDYYGFSLARANRTDCLNLAWGKSYNMNIPFRRKAIKIEVKFRKDGNMFLDAITSDIKTIEKELYLGKYDTIKLISSPPQIRVEMPAQIANTKRWDEYIEKMIRIILKLREIVDRYEFCY